MDDADVDVEELMRQAEALEAEALPPKSIFAQEERDVIDAAERLAGSESVRAVATLRRFPSGLPGFHRHPRAERC